MIKSLIKLCVICIYMKIIIIRRWRQSWYSMTTISKCTKSTFLKSVVTPLLKKDSLDPDKLKNYRPVSNLSFVSKILQESYVQAFFALTKVNMILMSHSTETAVLWVKNDILRAIDNGHCVFLVLLNLSATFDTVSHNIILKRLTSNYGVCGRALDWIKSYLTDRS